MSRGRVLGTLMMLSAIIFLVIGFTTAFDEQGSTELGYPIIALGLAFMVIGAFGMTFKPKKTRGSVKGRKRRKR